MAKVAVYNMEGKEVDSIELNDSIFGVEINEHLVHMAVLQQLANNRQGTQKAKTRSEVRGGGRKPWRQKGTGQNDEHGHAHAQAVHDGGGDGHGGAHTQDLHQNGVVGNQTFF